MNNNQIPKLNQIQTNYFPMPYMPFDQNKFSFPQNNFSLPLSMNQNLAPSSNIQYSLLHLLFPDQFLYPNQPYFLPNIFMPPVKNPLNTFNNLMVCQNILNKNEIINNIEINGQKINNINNKNCFENNCYNNNYLNNNEINNEKSLKQNNIDIINQVPKKFVIFHEKNNLEKTNNSLNINNDTIKNSEINNKDFDFNLLNKNKEIDILNKNYEKKNETKEKE